MPKNNDINCGLNHNRIPILFMLFSIEKEQKLNRNETKNKLKNNTQCQSWDNNTTCHCHCCDYDESSEFRLQFELNVCSWFQSYFFSKNNQR